MAQYRKKNFFCFISTLKILIMEKGTFTKLLNYSNQWKPQALRAVFYSIVEKLFDILPEILIGIAVDLVVNKQASFLDGVLQILLIS